jgi:hypothetical protein
MLEGSSTRALITAAAIFPRVAGGGVGTLRVKSERLIEGRKWHGRGRGRRAERQVKAREIGRLWALMRVAYLRMAK